jgi:hypothetical protein
MKKGSKKNTGVYAFLDTSRLLENGTGEEIEKTKKEYWKEYRREYNKIKRKENKSFQILFNFKEAKIIARQAGRYQKSEPNYIKQAALADKQNIVDWVAAGEIRELVILHHTTLLNLTDQNELSGAVGNRLIDQASQIEKRILDLFSSLK